MRDLKSVYKASTKETAEHNLDKLEAKWGKQYPIVLRSWRTNWERLSNYFKYPEPIRKLIYTTNTVEGYHRMVRKVTKTKGAFPNEMSLLKLVYLVTQRVQEKWISPLPNWSLTVQQLVIKFGNRMTLDLRL